MFSQAKKHLCQTFRKESVLPPRENRSRAALDSSKKMRQVIKGTALATIRINKIKTTEFDTRPKENEGRECESFIGLSRVSGYLLELQTRTFIRS